MKTKKSERKMKALKKFIGDDPKEAVTFHVNFHPLLERSSKPI